jgi:organic hydroperoxide reductase OsmC/OhrA
MMQEVKVSLRNIPGTRAATGWAGSHTLVVDRPEGKAGGMGLGFNGAELLALSLGGCFCNDLRHAAERLGTDLSRVEVDVKLTLAGNPPIVTRARMQVRCEAVDGSHAENVIAEAEAVSTVSRSLQRGMAVEIARAAR